MGFFEKTHRQLLQQTHDIALTELTSILADYDLETIHFLSRVPSYDIAKRHLKNQTVSVKWFENLEIVDESFTPIAISDFSAFVTYLREKQYSCRTDRNVGVVLNSPSEFMLVFSETGIIEGAKAQWSLGAETGFSGLPMLRSSEIVGWTSQVLNGSGTAEIAVTFNGAVSNNTFTLNAGNTAAFFPVPITVTPPTAIGLYTNSISAGADLNNMRIALQVRQTITV